MPRLRLARADDAGSCRGARLDGGCATGHSSFVLARLTLAVAVLAAGCTHAARVGESPVVDEDVGSYGGVTLGSMEEEVRRVFGEPGDGAEFSPLGESWSEVGGAPAVRNWPPGWEGRPTVLRYDGVAFLVGPKGVFAFVVSEEGAATKRGVAIGDPLARARRADGAGCGQQPYGESLFGGTRSFSWCRTTIGHRVRLWFGRDPIRSITVARVGRV